MLIRTAEHSVLLVQGMMEQQADIGQSSAHERSPVPSPGGSLGGEFGRITWVLALLLAALIIAKRWKRRMAEVRRPADGLDLLRIVDSRPLAPGRSIHVVEAAGRWFLIGSSEGGLHALGTLDESVNTRHIGETES